MDEALLVDLMSGLDTELLQNNYIEKDMNRGKIPILNRIFSFKKASIFSYENIFHNTENDEILVVNACSEDTAIDGCMADTMKSEDDQLYNEGLSISIFKKGFPNLVKIISGITAAFVVLSGIILFFVRHHKIVVKLFNKKAQIIY